MERLYDAGAVEVFTAPVGMKKCRPGVLLTALCRESEREAVVSTMLRHTTTLGVREATLRRHVFARRVETADTPLGPARVKVSEGCGVTRREYGSRNGFGGCTRERSAALPGHRAAGRGSGSRSVKSMMSGQGKGRSSSGTPADRVNG